MSLNTAQLEYLAAKGLSIADAVELSRLGDIRKDPTAAERKRRQRERENNASRVTSRCDPPNDIYSNPDILSPEDDKSSSTPKQKRTRVGSGYLLPADWVPILTPAAQKIVDGWPPGWLDTQVAAFRDHATDKGRKSKDWQAAFRTWLGKADEWGRQKNGNNRNNGGASAGKTDAWQSVLHDVANGPPDPRAAAIHGGMQGAGGMGRDAIGYRA